jgi:cell division protein ZapD
VCAHNQSVDSIVSSQTVTFEHPLNERIRTFLRLEHLFDRMSHFLPQADEWATRAAMESLLDVLSITLRSDIKTEILKELERHTIALERLGKQPGVDAATLNQILKNLEDIAGKIYQLGGQIAQTLRENDFIKSIIQRSSIPGGTCSFDLPHYHYWLNLPHSVRQAQVDVWMQDMIPIRDGLALLLSLARNSADPRPVIASAGFFQDVLNPQIPVQMVRVQFDACLPLFPEVSGHKHRFNIRFMEVAEIERPTQTERNVDFMLTCCVF